MYNGNPQLIEFFSKAAINDIHYLKTAYNLTYI
jgi:hypothetical protein